MNFEIFMLGFFFQYSKRICIFHHKISLFEKKLQLQIIITMSKMLKYYSNE
jgi:hypothetical protein